MPTTNGPSQQGAENSGTPQYHLLPHVSEFTEWGGQSWAYLSQYALSRLGSLENKRVLEIGFRFGKMTSLFALLGARVTALETDASAIATARKEVARWGVS